MNLTQEEKYEVRLRMSLCYQAGHIVSLCQSQIIGSNTGQHILINTK